jgi:hypothetical protein
MEILHNPLIIITFVLLTTSLQELCLSLSVFTLQWTTVRTHFGGVSAAASRRYEVVSRRIVADGTRPGISSLASL